MNINNLLTKEKESINGLLQKEKKEVIDFAERKLNDLKLDLTLIDYPKDIKWVISTIITHYFSRNFNSEKNRSEWRKYGDLQGNNWIEKISYAQDKEGVNAMHSILLYTTTDFGAKETEKFQEVTKKMKELKQENEKEKIDKEKITRLINELKPFSTTTVNEEHEDFPIVSRIFHRKIGSLIENAEYRKNEKEKTKSDKEISEKISEKTQEKEKTITSVLKEAKNESDPEKLAALLKQIEEINRGNEIEESTKNEVRELKKKVLSSEPNAGKKVFDELNNSLSQNDLNEENLDEETREELKNLKNEKNNEEIVKKEESLIEKIGIIAAKKKLEILVEKVQDCLKKNLLDKIANVKKEVIQFISENSHNYKAYLANKFTVDQALTQAENKISNFSKQEPEPMWKKVIIPVSLLAGAITIMAILVTKKKNRRNF